MDTNISINTENINSEITLNKITKDNNLIEDDFISLLNKIAQTIYIKLGPGHSEFIYHRAMEIELRENNILYESEMRVVIKYITNKNKYNIGEEKVDIYLPTNKIIIELKAVVNPPREVEIDQINKYKRELQKDNIDIYKGILINFPQSGTKIARDKIDFIII